MGVEVDWMMAEPEGGSSSDRSQHSDDASGQSPQASDSQASGSPSGNDAGSEQSPSPGEGPSQQSGDDVCYVVHHNMADIETTTMPVIVDSFSAHDFPNFGFFKFGVPVMDGNSWNLPVTPDMGEGKPGDKTCLICGDRATGLHYGIVSCEGCKGFFKRSICNKRVYRCSRNKNCVMSRKQRNRCQYCRLLKCLQMGMNRKAIREDGMPGGRNKSIGPVEISEEEIERIMSGKEFEEEEQQEASSTTNADGSLSFSTQANGMGGIQGLNGVGGLDLSSLNYGSLSQGVLADKSQGSNTYMPGLPSYGNAHSMAIPTSMGHLDPQSATLLDQLLRAEDFDPLHTHIMVEDDYEVSKHELFCLLCKIADEMLFRQITWIKKLPFLSEISISDLSTLLTNTWHEISFLSALCVHKPQLFGEFGSIILKYQPTNEELEQFSDDGMEIVERTMYLSGKLHQMKITKEEFVCMKVINFLNQDVKNLRDAELIESVNKRFWYACQDYIEAQYPHQPTRFRELMMCLPEIRYVTSKILDIPIEHLPLLFKAIMHSCKVNSGHPSILCYVVHHNMADIETTTMPVIVDSFSAHDFPNFGFFKFGVGEGKPGDKTCLICGDRATGLHYGIVSCEGCKGFFKRSICNKRVYRCSRNKNCVMSRKQRNRCQYCRLLKCLQMGMNRKAIREDGMPGGRNKSIGPVEISEEEIERIMSGKEFEEEEQQEASSTTNADGSLSFSTQANGMGGIQGLNGVGGLDLSSLNYGSLSQGVLADKSQGSNTYMPGLPSYGNAHSMAIPTSMGHLDPQSATLLDQLLRAEDFDPLHTHIMVEDDYEVSKHELFCLLCKIADEMLFRQITWIKKLPFLSEISISDLSTLLTNTWHEISFLSALCVHKPQLFGEFGSIILKYQPTNEELEQFSDDGMEIVERTMYLSGKLHQMKITKEEFVCMKVINFLNQDVKNLRDAELIESVNKRFWYACQDYIEAQYPHQPTRFRELMMCLPEIRYVTSKILDIPIEHLPLLFKAIMHSCKVNSGHPSISCIPSVPVQISFLSALCVHKPQLFGEFGSIILKYQPTNEELEQFSDDGMEIVERTMYLSGKLHQMKITKEEFVCMKVINFLNQEILFLDILDVKNLRDAELIESVNKRFWYACQDYIEAQYPHQPTRFRELMMCLPEIRYVTSKILDIPIEHLPLLFKAIMHSCKVNSGHPSICVSA
uniref:Nuclear receptor subfamily 6 group A member 1-like n=1 Tax=Branchiostoma floridae TaxID=7739 RepID=C3Z7Z3_BRAFL|eukprot:XP_002595295.1 hypothetical protein BRAFLDRAFT_96828 [Branchiostoma floridae]